MGRLSLKSLLFFFLKFIFQVIHSHQQRMYVFYQKIWCTIIYVSFQDESVVLKSLLPSIFLKAPGMQRFIGSMAIGILCIQWSFPASAGPAICQPIVKLAQPLSVNGSFVTQITTAQASFFRLNCSCDVESQLSGPASLRIIEPRTVRNGMATISFGSSGDVEEISYMLIENTSTTGEYIVEFPYFVKVSTSGGQPLEAGFYSVMVQFESSPVCSVSSG